MAKYKIVGPHAVHGVEPGGTVDLEPGDHVEFLIGAGHIAPARSGGPKTSKPDEGETESE